MLGAWHRNCAFVPLSTQHTPEELSYFLSDTSPQCVVTNAAYETTIAPIAKKLDIPVVNVEDALATTAHQGARQILPTSANDAALVVYTSGTTGNDKMLRLSVLLFARILRLWIAM
jgi:long-subunit acyl-CoA synthetase (AMP-forming)